jgi:hypothetical protein
MARGCREEPAKAGDGLGVGKIMVDAGADAGPSADAVLSLGAPSGRIGWRASRRRGSRRRESTPVKAVPDRGAAMGARSPLDRGFSSGMDGTAASRYMAAAAGASDPWEVSRASALPFFGGGRAVGACDSFGSDAPDAQISDSAPEDGAPWSNGSIGEPADSRGGE